MEKSTCISWSALTTKKRKKEKKNRKNVESALVTRWSCAPEIGTKTSWEPEQINGGLCSSELKSLWSIVPHKFVGEIPCSQSDASHSWASVPVFSSAFDTHRNTATNSKRDDVTSCTDRRKNYIVNDGVKHSGNGRYRKKNSNRRRWNCNCLPK